MIYRRKNSISVRMKQHIIADIAQMILLHKIMDPVCLCRCRRMKRKHPHIVPSTPVMTMAVCPKSESETFRTDTARWRNTDALLWIQSKRQSRLYWLRGQTPIRTSHTWPRHRHKSPLETATGPDNIRRTIQWPEQTETGCIQHIIGEQLSILHLWLIKPVAHRQAARWKK